MTKQFPVNNMNKSNRMMIIMGMMMMKIFFDVRDGEKKFSCTGRYMILICFFIKIRYLQLLFLFMSSFCISCAFCIT
jgi:hypothetical protein